MKNPTWQRDELILALDIYFRFEYNKLSSKHTEVVELSKILNRLPIFPKEQRLTTFRNPEGVYMKLGNFLSIDPNDQRKGLPSYGKLDETIFHEYINKQEDLKEITQIIKQSIDNDLLYNQLKIENNEDSYEEIHAKEGRIIYRIHKIRERNKNLIKKKKQQVLQRSGKLSCEVCEFDFKETYGHLGEGFIECHHVMPVSKMKIECTTRLSDLILVCANCHRMLHKNLLLKACDLKLYLNK